MKNTTLALLTLVVLIGVALVFRFSPVLRPLAEIFLDWAGGIINVTVGVLLVLGLAADPGILGFLAKGYGLKRLDSWLDKELSVTLSQRFILGLLSAIVVGVLWLSLVRIVVQDWNPTYGFFKSFFQWNGVWEDIPAWWPISGVIAAVSHLFVWTQTEHER